MSVSAERAQLKAWLQTALELELSTIPPYMMALLSLKLPANREVAELIRSVMVEEMLHMALVANVLNAVGGQPRLDAQAVPTYPLTLTFEGQPFRDRTFPVNIEPFSPAALATFLAIEQPQPPPVRRPRVALTVPAPTIGEFYGKMSALLDVLETEPGGAIVGDPARQIPGDYFWSGGGRVIAVTDLVSAKAALILIAEQGEGAWPPATGAETGFSSHFDMGHWYRFRQIQAQRRYLRTDDPTQPPTGPAIAVDYTAVYAFKINPTPADYPAGGQLQQLNRAFNLRYSRLLRALENAMNGAPKGLYDAIMDHMRALTPLAHEMMKLPLDSDKTRSGCPTFAWEDPGPV
ncbi:ferritin-like domain-containing protein [Xanthobacter autotrophicus]|uniref:ferritin-like domain-containing protein n=1 Tax=Xanthobacter autotrophicus TaxID=280 RepID=UPI00372A83DD